MNETNEDIGDIVEPIIAVNYNHQSHQSYSLKTDNWKQKENRKI